MLKIAKIACFVFTPILSACTVGFGGESSKAPSKSRSSSSHVCVDGDYESSYRYNPLEKVFGNKIYFWRNSCGEMRSIALDGCVNENYKLIDFLCTAQSIGGYTFSEMKKKIMSQRFLSLDSYFVFEISSHFDESELREFERYPYPFLCTDESIYESLGIQESYSWISKNGLLFRDKAVYLPPDDQIDISYLNNLDAFVCGDYAAISVRDVNHVFHFKNGRVDSHRQCPFVFFDPAKVEDAPGLDFDGVIEKFGVPSFVVDEGSTDFEYCYSWRLFYRFEFAPISEGGCCKAVQKLGIDKTLFIGDKSEPIDRALINESLLLTPLDSLIRRFGKPVKDSSSAGNHREYKTSEGTKVSFILTDYGLKFEERIHGGVVGAISIDGELITIKSTWPTA